MTGVEVPAVSSAATVAAVVLALAMFGLIAVWQKGLRTGRRIERTARRVTRIGTMLLAAVVVGAGVAALQWAVLRPAAAPHVVWVGLGVPALFTGFTVARLGAVTVGRRMKL